MPTGFYVRTEEYKKKMSGVMKGRLKGRKLLEEHKRNIGRSMVGNKNAKGFKPSEETRRKISLANRGKIRTIEQRKRYRETQLGDKNIAKRLEIRKRISISLTGRVLSEETKRRMSEAHKGERSHFWKGGISETKQLYPLTWNKSLRKIIKERDNFVCQICLNKGTDVHHIDYDKKNCVEDNLITLCHSCHSKTNNNRNDWIQYFACNYSLV